MQKCPKCGFENQDNAQACQKCANIFHSENFQDQTNQNQESQNQNLQGDQNNEKENQTFSGETKNKVSLWLVGILTIIIGTIATYFYWTKAITSSVSIWITVFEFCLLVINSFILFIFAKAFKSPQNFYKKAVLFVGVVYLLIITGQFLGFLGIPNSVISILSLALLVGEIIFLSKLYLLSIGKSIGLLVVSSIISGIIGIVLFLIFSFAGLIKFSQLLGNTFNQVNNNQQVEESLNSNFENNFNFEETTDNVLNRMEETLENKDGEENFSSSVDQEEYYKAISYLPSDFPEINKNIIFSVEDNKEYSAYQIFFESPDKFEDVVFLYKNYFQEKGWVMDNDEDDETLRVLNDNGEPKIRLIFNNTYEDRLMVTLTLWYNVLENNNIQENNSDKNVDSDNDGLSDRDEIIYGSDPNIADTDGDGYLDGEEVENGYDPIVPGSARLEDR